MKLLKLLPVFLLLFLQQTQDASASIELKINTLPAGLYYLDVQTEQGSWVEKVVVEK